MRLIIDSGSTKMEWILLDGETVKDRFTTMGFNPNYSERQDFKTLLKSMEKRFITSLNNDDAISQRDKSISLQAIHYYGTGCGIERNCLLIKEVLQQYFPLTEITVTHDLMAACHALLGQGKGIACILGTGSNSCLYNGEIIVDKAVSLGYLIGDEGSGMHIGKEMLRGYFYGFMPDDLRRQFNATYHLDLASLLQNLYHQVQPSRYMASFARFAGENLSHPYIHDLVKGCFKAFIEAFVCCYSECNELKINFIGSVAYHFQEILKEVLTEYGLAMGEIMHTPAEGLIRYYCERG